jgi:hypothetical protein
MPKLDFEYDESASRNGAEYVAEYRGLTIRAVQDSHCSNPWLDSDGFAPLLYFSLGDSGVEDLSGRYDIESPLKRFSDYRLGRDWRELCRAIGVDPAELQTEIDTNRKEYGGRLADYRRDKLEEYLGELKPSDYRGWGAACGYFEALEELWRLAGVEALDFQRNGYSQGDSVRGLLVALPAWREAMGVPDRLNGAAYDMQADLQAQADVFGAWVFGDCYGFVIESPEGESLDSCWGFVGDDFAKSGLAEAAKESADYIVESAAKRKAEKLKELIRARVPVALRPAILEAAGRVR